MHSRSITITIDPNDPSVRKVLQEVAEGVAKAHKEEEEGRIRGGAFITFMQRIRDLPHEMRNKRLEEGGFKPMTREEWKSWGALD